MHWKPLTTSTKAVESAGDTNPDIEKAKGLLGEPNDRAPPRFTVWSLRLTLRIGIWIGGPAQKAWDGVGEADEEEEDEAAAAMSGV